jgi:hypothetical protein
MIRIWSTLKKLFPLLRISSWWMNRCLVWWLSASSSGRIYIIPCTETCSAVVEPAINRKFRDNQLGFLFFKFRFSLTYILTNNVQKKLWICDNPISRNLYCQKYTWLEFDTKKKTFESSFKWNFKFHTVLFDCWLILSSFFLKQFTSTLESTLYHSLGVVNDN